MENPLRNSWIEECSEVSQEGMALLSRDVDQSMHLFIVLIQLFIHDWIYIYSVKNGAPQRCISLPLCKILARLLKRSLIEVCYQV